MKIGRSTTLAELAFVVGTALHNAGLTAVLSGGGAATVYAPDAIQSRDLEFVLGFWSSLGHSDDCLVNLGFRLENGSYVHSESMFTLEFPSGPLSIGHEIISTWDTLRRSDMVLQIITPTDCVRDRLSWFLFYQSHDFQALEQALAVAVRQKIDIERVRSWALAEGAADQYRIFEMRLSELMRG